MNFVEQWQRDDPSGKHKLIACPHLSSPDGWPDSGTRLVTLTDNGAGDVTTLALCGVCASTVVGSLVDDVIKRAINAVWSEPVVTVGQLINQVTPDPIDPFAPVRDRIFNPLVTPPSDDAPTP